LVRVLEQSGLSFELIVVDDGSTDRTQEVVTALDLPIRPVRHHQNQGYGASLKTGIKQARFSWVVIIDADGTYPQDSIPLLVQTAWEKEGDMVVGARTKKDAHIPRIRRPAKKILGWLAGYLSGTPIPDLNSGLRVMRKDVVERFIHLLPEGFSFTSTITLAMLTNGYKVFYLPIDYYKRKGKSKINPVRDTLNFFTLIIRMALYFDPLKVFVPLGLLIFGLSWVILIGSYFFARKVMDVTFGVFLMASVLIFAIGMLADLIDKRFPLYRSRD
jgi:glycosyltransferase involved in cell wall biosynthesis